MEQSLRNFFPEGSEMRSVLPDVVVPCYIRGFQKQMPEDPEGSPSGPETFMLAIIDTTAVFEATAEFHGNEELRLGWAPTCPNTVLAKEPHTFYAPESPKGEPAAEEGYHFSGCPFDTESTPLGSSCPVFADISSGCGSNLGRGWGFSLYLTARDTRSLPTIVYSKLDAFKNAIEGTLDGYVESTLPTYEGGDESTRAYILREISESRESYDDWLESGVPADQDHASKEMGDILQAIKRNPSHFDNSTRNVAGEIAARALSLKFFICKGSADVASCLAQD